MVSEGRHTREGKTMRHRWNTMASKWEKEHTRKKKTSEESRVSDSEIKQEITEFQNKNIAIAIRLFCFFQFELIVRILRPMATINNVSLISDEIGWSVQEGSVHSGQCIHLCTVKQDGVMFESFIKLDM